MSAVPLHAEARELVQYGGNRVSALVRQCLDRRIAPIEQLREEVAAWVADRNAQALTIHWRFTAQAVRQNLHRHYQKVCSKN